jgi:uncharacterized integral membrane protein
MTDTNQFANQVFDEFQPKKKMPDMLNVLTILTFIGSGISIITSFWDYFKGCDRINETIEAINKVGEDSTMGKFMKSTLDIAYKSCEMKLPILIMGLVCAILCIVGAIMMRNLNKKGYFVYLIGEIVAPLAMMVLVGMNMGIIAVISIFFPVLFLILYGTQLKHMK